jgi:hypothetical protein
MARTPKVDVTPTVPADHKVGDRISYTGALGTFDGIVAEVRELVDEAGAKLRAFVVHLEGVGRLLTTGDALAPAAVPTPAVGTAVTAVPADEAQADGGDVDAPPAA